LAKSAHGLVEHAIDFIGFRNVGWNRKRAMPNFLRRFLQSFPSPADQRDPRSFSS